MKKILLLALIVVVLVLGSAPLQAAPIATLTDLAQYYPAGTPVIAMLQTDDGFIGELDSVLAKVTAKLPAEVMPPGVSLQALLDMGAMQLSGQGFADGVRSWLGDSIAFGVLNAASLSSSEPQFLLAISITDRAGAEAFATQMLTQSGAIDEYETRGMNGYTVIMPKADSYTTGVIVIGEDVAFVAMTLLDVPFAGVSGETLADNPAFSATLDLLPEDSYSALIYADTAAIAGMAASAGEAQALAQIAGQEAIGFTILDGKSLVMDVVVNTGDVSVLEQVGLNLGSTTPVDPGFAAYLPADASLVAHAANLANAYDTLLTVARQSESTPGEIDAGLTQVTAMLQALTGLDLNEDIVGWMTGDFAVFINFDTEKFLEMGFMQQPVEELPMGFGLVIEATDPAKAKALAAGIAQALPLLTGQNENITVSQDQIGDTEVSIVSVEFPDATPAIPPLHVVIGANDKVFVVASRTAAKAIFSGAGGLDAAPSFAEASRYLLDNATSTWYTDTNGFGVAVSAFGLTMVGPVIGDVFDNIVTEMVPTMAGATPPPTLTPDEIQQREQERLQQMRQQIDMLLNITNIVSSGSISTAISDAGDVTARFVLTLAD